MKTKNLSKILPNLLGVLGLSCFAIAGPASAADKPNPETSIAEYRVDWRALPLLYTRMTAKRRPGSYDIFLSTKGAFMMRWLIRERLDMKTRGRIDKDGTLRPQMARQVFHRSGKTTMVITTRFAKETGKPTTKIVPPEGKKHRPSVPAKLLVGVTDPLSAALQAAMSPMDAKPCVYQAEVYDGRRRIRIVSKLVGKRRLPILTFMKNLPEYGYVCAVQVTRLAGFRKKHFKRFPKLPPIEVVTVPVPKQKQWIIFYVGIQSPYGPVHVRLMRLRHRK